MDKNEEISPDLRLFGRNNRKEILAAIRERVKVTIECQHKPYSFVAVEVEFDGKKVDGIGFSKVCYPDIFDSEKGLAIAKERAISSAYHQIEDFEFYRAFSYLIESMAKTIESKKQEKEKADELANEG